MSQSVAFPIVFLGLPITVVGYFSAKGQNVDCPMVVRKNVGFPIVSQYFPMDFMVWTGVEGF